METTAISDLYARSFRINAPFSISTLEFAVCGNCGLEFFDPMETGNEAFYEQLQKFDWYYMDMKPEYAIAARHLPASGRVLEVGAGRAAFAGFVGSGRYTGLEFNDKAIERARVAGIHLLKEPVEEHAVNHAGAYNAVVSFQVLEHVSRPGKFLQACVDCLAPGGRLMVAVPSADGFAGCAVNSVLDLPPHHVSRWRDATLRKIATLFGLRCLSIEHEPVADYHKTWARSVQVETWLRSRLGWGQPLIDVTARGRLLSVTAAVLGRLLPVPVRHLYGHTVFVCYEK